MPTEYPLPAGTQIYERSSGNTYEIEEPGVFRLVDRADNYTWQPVGHVFRNRGFYLAECSEPSRRIVVVDCPVKKRRIEERHPQYVN